jgi:hypothetical protein
MRLEYINTGNDMCISIAGFVHRMCRACAVIVRDHIAALVKKSGRPNPEALPSARRAGAQGASGAFYGIVIRMFIKDHRAKQMRPLEQIEPLP